MKLIFLVANITALSFCSVQTPSASDTTRIPVESLLGTWIATSDSSRIEFKKDHFTLEIYPIIHANPYMFMIDSSNTISPSGFAANWPPYGCELKLLDSVSLEIKWNSVFYPETREIYKKQAK